MYPPPTPLKNSFKNTLKIMWLIRTICFYLNKNLVKYQSNITIRKPEKTKEEQIKEEESDKQDLNSMKTSNNRNKKQLSIE